MANFFKPRYKICFQTHNQTWINKNSRLKGFYNLRSPRQIMRPGKYRQRLKLKNMKWTIARRFMIPRRRNKNYPRFRYGNNFKNKQQLKKFYGKIKEYQLQQIFKATWIKKKTFKRSLFIGALEQRLDLILYRSKILPTIFSCNQLINHQGIYINNILVTTSNYKIKTGDIISFDPIKWSLFYDRLYHKLVTRSFGHKILHMQRKRKLLKFKKYKKSFRSHFNIALEIQKIQYQYFLLCQIFKTLEKKKLLDNKDLQLLKKILIVKIKPKIKVFKHLKYFLEGLKYSRHKNKNYTKTEFKIIVNIISLQKYINKFIYLSKIQQIKKNFNIENLDKAPRYQEKINTEVYAYLIKKKQLKKLTKNLIYRGPSLQKIKKQKFISRRIHFKNNRKKRNTWWQSKPHWYTPNYLEIDYNTLRIAYLYNPSSNQVFYPFFCSFDDIIMFYKNKGF